MSNPKLFGAAGLIQSVLKCDDETALAVKNNLGGVLSHQPTRAFIAIAWHLANTTVPTKGTGDKTVYINEGKRMAGLFMVQCAGTGLDLSNFSEPEKEIK
jgi:hypothetical protein